MNLNKQNMNEAFKTLQKLTLQKIKQLTVEIKKEFEKDIQNLPKEFQHL